MFKLSFILISVESNFELIESYFVVPVMMEVEEGKDQV